MSNSRFLWATGLLTLAVFSGSVFAQDGEGPRGPRGPGRGGPPGGFGGRPGGIPLIQVATDSQVQKLLDVSAEQSGYLKLLKEESQAEDKKFFDSLRDSDTSREERFQKMQEYRSKQVPEMDKQLKEILGEDKLKRLKEVNLQANGSMALLSPEISKEVGLTEDQKSQLQSTLQETIRESFARFGGGPGGPPGGPGGGPPPGDGPPRGGPGREQFESIRKDLETKFLAVLTDKQKERWTKMLGEPAKIDFDKLRENARERGRGGERRRPPRNQGDGET